MGAWLDENEDRVFWSLFGSLLFTSGVLNVLPEDLSNSQCLMAAFGGGVAPAMLYWGMGARRRAVVFQAVRRAGWGQIERAILARLVDWRAHNPILWWCALLASRVVMACVVGGLLTVCIALMLGEEGPEWEAGFVVGTITALLFALFGSHPLRWVRRVILLLAELG